MVNHEFRRELIRAANRPKFGVSPGDVQDLLDWFENMPTAEFNGLLHNGSEFPDDYIAHWQRTRTEGTGT